jgi:hypothetical protein
MPAPASLKDKTIALLKERVTFTRGKEETELSFYDAVARLIRNAGTDEVFLIPWGAKDNQDQRAALSRPEIRLQEALINLPKVAAPEIFAPAGQNDDARTSQIIVGMLPESLAGLADAYRRITPSAENKADRDAAVKDIETLRAIAEKHLGNSKQRGAA